MMKIIAVPLSMLILFSATGFAGDWKAGSASVSITPAEPIVLLGYSDRSGPFTSVDLEIFAKALAIEDASGNRGVIVTTDLVGVQDEVFGEVCRRIEERTGLRREQILLNASHNHTGPLVSLNPVWEDNIAYSGMTPADASRTVAYTRSLQDKVVHLVETALSHLEPVRLSWGSGEVGFVMNRRILTDRGVVMGPNPKGPIDPMVPVLKVEKPSGELMAVLFGCACHNTTLTGAHNLISGDYAGYAQKFLSEAHPGAEFLFLSGCGADANPEPRGTLPQARDHGRELAEVVESVLSGPMTPIEGLLETRLEWIDLPLQRLSREEIEAHAGAHTSQALMARQMLKVLDDGEPLPETQTAPIGFWRMGDSLRLAALPAEPVAEYALRIREMQGGASIWATGYNNDCFGYLPTARIAAEGGHEAIGITLWIWGRHLRDRVGFFAPEVEKAVLEAVMVFLENPSD